MKLRAMTADDRSEIAELIYISLNHWYQIHSSGPIFKGGPEATDVFYQVYEALDPGCCILAENPRTGRIMGCSFYHPRQHHVALGITGVHPNYFGIGVGKALVQYIIDFTERQEHKTLRLTQSAMNLDSFSLYNKLGCVPRCAYQDMFIQVPEAGTGFSAVGTEYVRDATFDDVAAMSALEMDVSSVTREKDYRYCIENEPGFWHISVYDNGSGQLDGFMISSAHPAVNMLGPGVARTEQAAIAMICRELDYHKGRCPVFLIPMEKQKLVRQMYDWGARNCEMHFCQVRGQFKPFNGVNMPMFLMETA